MKLKRLPKGDGFGASAVAQRFRMLETRVLLANATALISLGPLRNNLRSHYSVLFAATLALFITPGMLLWHWFMKEQL